jgi:hypothetical protein
VEDVQLAGQINRVRRFYFDAAPQVARYLTPSSQDTPAAIAAQAGVSGPSWYQFLVMAGALAVVNSVLIGGLAGVVIQAGTRAVAASAAAGVITGTAALVAHLTRQRATWRAARATTGTMSAS